ncbi:hypothetical protein [Microvirga roseola]|uniref:hypothetical protein n=1 Tax=Microvirga roseola TaxID=2883126 RepID=UPI001E414236|nr:hypothetical protein [Microvirga roseola]
MTKISVGDEVRVYYHPSGLTVSFAEGVVSRVDVSTLRGRAFIVDVTYEVVLDREQAIRPGYRNYVLYERADDFPGRIEILSKIQQEPEQDVVPEIALETASEPDPFLVEVERPVEPASGGIVASLLGRRR